MAEFQYKVLASNGSIKKGNIQAATKEQAYTVLREDKYTVVSIEEIDILKQGIRLSLFEHGITSKDYSAFCRQFASMIAAGVGLVEGLGMMIEQTDNRRLKMAINEIHYDMARGSSMVSSMRKRADVFPMMLCDMVEAGEASGRMDVVFDRMAVQLEKEAVLNGRLKKVFLYPAAILLIALVVLSAVLVFIIPDFIKMYEGLNVELPVIIELTKGWSAFMQRNIIHIAAGAAGLGILLKIYSATESSQYIGGLMGLHIPIFGGIVRKSNCARLGRTLSTLLVSGVPMVTALDITVRKMTNVHYKMAVLEAKGQVSRGIPLFKPLESCGLFPPMVTNMVAIGEETGKVSDMLEKVADCYEEDVQTATGKILSFLIPLTIALMAFMAGFLILAAVQSIDTLYHVLHAMQT